MYEVKGLPSIVMSTRRPASSATTCGAFRARSGRGGGKPSDLDVAVPDAVAVILKQDEAVLQLAEARDVLEFALRDGFAQGGTVELVLEHARAVQIVLHRRTVRNDPALVELPGRLQRTILRGQHVVERGRLAVRSYFRIGMPLVVYELVLVADSRWHIFEDEILQPAVAAFGDAPLPRQVESVELDRRDDIERAPRVGAVAGIDGQQPVFDLPPGAGRVGFLVAVPAVERLPVEEKNPAGLLFRRRELVVDSAGAGGAGGFCAMVADASDAAVATAAIAGVMK